MRSTYVSDYSYLVLLFLLLSSASPESLMEKAVRRVLSASPSAVLTVRRVCQEIRGRSPFDFIIDTTILNILEENGRG